MISPQAIIDPKAEIADSVTIGPFSVIGAGVKIAAGTEIGPHVVIKGETEIGKDNKFFQFSSIGEDPQDKKYNGEVTRLEIGDRNQIREFVTINRGTAQDGGLTSIGSDNLLMAYTHVAHDCHIGSNTILANAGSLAGHVVIDDWAILGGFTMVHQYCHVGAHSFSAMGSAIAKDVPPYVLVGGQPAKPRGINVEGLKRRDFSAEQVARIKQAYKTLYHSKLLLDDAISELKSNSSEFPEMQFLVDFLHNSQRSIVR